MILYTGDTHGDVTRIQKIAYKQNLTENDLEANCDIINKIIKQRGDK